MKVNSTVLIIAALLFSTVFLSAQTRGIPKPVRDASTSQDELISMSGATSFPDALLILNRFSERYLKKMIIDPSDKQTAIGIDVDLMHWLSALELILRTNDLWYVEYPGYIKITSAGSSSVGSVPPTPDEASELYLSREVTIAAVFFEVDISKLRSAGTSWSIFRDKDVNATASNLSADNQGGLFELSVDPDLSFADISATFKALENEQVGEVVASPSITVGSGEEGRIQVGSDIAVTVLDYAGNSVTQFFSTGSIIKVVPQILSHNGTDFVRMVLEVERSSSSASPGGGLEIQKSAAKTTLNLLDQEQTMIGGLNVNEEASTRDGVPFLKDLPWWFFGLRYLFGYESKSWIKKELIILIRAELVPTIEDRASTRERTGVEKNTLREYRLDLKRRLDEYKSGQN